MAELGDLTGLASAIQAVSGTKTKQTQQTKISDQGIQELLRGILSGPGGVKNVGSAARKSGLFNSTTEENALEDLFARAANQAELARSPTTTTTTVGGVGIGPLIGTLAATSALSSIFKGEVPFAGIADKIFGGGGATAAGAAPIVEGVPTGAAAELISAGADLGLGAGVQGAGSATGAVAASGGAGNFLASGALPLGGAFLAGLLGGDGAKDPESLALSSLGGFATLGPIGLLAAPAATFLGSLFGDGGLSSITKGLKSGIKSIGNLFGL